MCFIQTVNQIDWCRSKKETNLELELCVRVLDNMNLSVFVINLLKWVSEFVRSGFTKLEVQKILLLTVGLIHVTLFFLLFLFSPPRWSICCSLTERFLRHLVFWSSSPPHGEQLCTYCTHVNCVKTFYQIAHYGWIWNKVLILTALKIKSANKNQDAYVG